jgi:hypothetical protein
MSALEDVAGSYRRLLGVPVLRGLALADAVPVASAGTTGGPGSAEGADGIRRLARLLVAVAARLAGLCLGPSLATLFSLASSAVPGAAGTGETTSTGDAGAGWNTGAGGGTEAQFWLNSAMNGGAAATGICYGKSRLVPRDHDSLRDRGPGNHTAKPSHTINFGRSPLILRGIWLYDRFLMLHFPAMKRPIMGKPKP